MVNHAVSDRVESDLQRAEMIALPITLAAARRRVRQRGGRPAAAGRRRARHHRHVRRAAAADHRSPTSRSSRSTSPPRSASASPSTTACSSSRGSGRSWPAATTPATAVVRTVAHRRAHGALQRRHGRRSRWRRCSCSPSPSSGRSPTPASPWPLMAALGAVVVLPALLAVLGHRVDKWALFHRRGAGRSAEGIWHRIATAVMQRPLPIATAAIVFLLVARLALPAHRLRPARRPGAAARATPPGSCRTPCGTTSPRDEASAARGRHDRASATRAERRRDRRLRRRRCRRSPAWPGSTPLTGSYVGGSQVAPAGPRVGRASPRPRPPGSSVVPSVEPMSADGRAARRTTCGPCRPRRRRSSAARRPSSSTPRTSLFSGMPAGRRHHRGRPRSCCCS